jgi:hypothetical protein
MLLSVAALTLLLTWRVAYSKLPVVVAHGERDMPGRLFGL